VDGTWHSSKMYGKHFKASLITYITLKNYLV